MTDFIDIAATIRAIIGNEAVFYVSEKYVTASKNDTVIMAGIYDNFVYFSIDNNGRAISDTFCGTTVYKMYHWFKTFYIEFNERNKYIPPQ